MPFAHNVRRGPANAKVTIVEFSDFECPFCNRSEPTVKGLLQKYGKDVALVWMNQPLPFHANAMGAAMAFQAAAARPGEGLGAARQDVRQLQDARRPDSRSTPSEVGLNVAKFKKDWDDPKIKDEVEQDKKAGTRSAPTARRRSSSTAARLSGAQPADAFEKVIDEEIKKADELLKKGTPLKDVYKKLIEEARPPRRRPRRRARGARRQAEHQARRRAGQRAEQRQGDGRPFSDFQCPFCSRAVPDVKEIEDDYKGKVKIAFKQLPLPFHDKAHLAAEAALAANEQGKFWPYHDKLFANQQALDRPSLEKYAEELGLNMGKFKAALDSGKFKDKVDSDAKEGAAVGATGTPTFFINGTKVVGAQPFPAFQTVIDQELKGKG